MLKCKTHAHTHPHTYIRLMQMYVSYIIYHICLYIERNSRSLNVKISGQRCLIKISHISYISFFFSNIKRGFFNIRRSQRPLLYSHPKNINIKVNAQLYDVICKK